MPPRRGRERWGNKKMSSPRDIWRHSHPSFPSKKLQRNFPGETLSRSPYFLCNISDALRFLKGDARPRSEPNTLNGTSCTSLGVKLKNAVICAGTRVALALGEAAEVIVMAVAGGAAASDGEGTVPGRERIDTRGLLCEEERECDSHESGDCSREETYSSRSCRCKQLCGGAK